MYGEENIPEEIVQKKLITREIVPCGACDMYYGGYFVPSVINLTVSPLSQLV